MKKNVMMRVASALLVAVLLTTCSISGTFAKYVTTNSAEDSARVAKFGVVIQADGSLYGDNYGTGTLSVPTIEADKTLLSVDADAKAVAPGTQSDEGLTFSINGTPEVRTKLDVTIAVENIYLTAGKYAVMVKAPTVSETSFKADTYYVKDAVGVYTLAAGGTYSDSTEYYTMEDFVNLTSTYYPVVYAADVTGDIGDDTINLIAADYAKKFNGNAAVTGSLTAGKTTYAVSKEYDPNFNYAGLDVAGDKLTWAWAIEQATDATMYNGADTILANLMYGTLTDAEVVKVDTQIKAPTAAAGSDLNDYHLNTSFDIEITVTQID